MTLEAEVCARLQAEWAKEAAPDFEKVEKAVKLDQYYVPTRYPTGLPGGGPSRFCTDPDEAREAMELARSVLEMVEERLRES
jgi:HEPN domain-containing protein